LVRGELELTLPRMQARDVATYLADTRSVGEPPGSELKTKVE